MANRDHSLDDGIIQAAYSEFLAYGFQKASLHKIAEKAGVTTGAIYTRYKNKDALFASLLQDFFETMQVLFAPIAEEYEKADRSSQPPSYPQQKPELLPQQQRLPQEKNRRLSFRISSYPFSSPSRKFFSHMLICAEKRFRSTGSPPAPAQGKINLPHVLLHRSVTYPLFTCS